MKAPDFKRRLALVLAADLVLAGLVLAGLMLRTGDGEAAAPLMQVMGIAAVDDLVFMNERGQVRVTGGPRRLLHAGGRSLPAAGQKLDAFLNSLERARVLRRVSANPASWKQFDLEDGAKTRIRFNHPGRTLELIFGKAGPGDADVYVRASGRNEVYLVDGGLVFYAEQGREYWSELRLFERAFEVRELSRLEVRIPDQARGTYTLVRGRDEKGAPSWLLPGEPGRRLNQRAVEALAADLAGVTGLAFVEDAPIGLTGLDGRAVSIELTSSGGQTYGLLIGKPAASGEWYAGRRMKGLQDLVYRIDESWRARVLKGLDALSD